MTRDELNEQLLRALTDNAPVVLWVLDRSGTFRLQQGQGISEEQGAAWSNVGKNVFEVYSEEQSRDARRALAGEVVHSFAELHDVSWENWMVPLRGPDGEVLGVAGFTIDITRAKRAESELRAQLEVVQRQQQVIRDLSTPIIEVWDGVLTLPMIGIVDSARTADVMQDLLSEIVRRGARFAVLDLTGVEVVDTSVANYLVSLVQAIRLLGAEGIVAGIRPSVAQTVVSLGLDLSGVTTHANLKAALKHCIQIMAREGAPARERGRRGGAPQGGGVTSP